MVPVIDLFLDRGREMRDVRRSARLAMASVTRSAAAKDRHARAWLVLRGPAIMFTFGIE